MNIAVVGATGMVGTQILKVLAENSFPITNLLLVASEKSIGNEIEFGGSKHAIISMEEAISRKPHIAIFSAGGDISRAFAQQFADAGTTVIDNSSAFRMDADKKLIVPEINANELTASDKIIANPNCSTIQMVLALSEIQKNYGIKRLVISTYQSITGTGVKAVRQMENERNNEKGEMAYPYPIDKNCLPHGGDFREDGYTTEEQKLVDETHKIFNDDTIGITATVVRVPVVGGHSEALNVECNKPFDISTVRKMLADTPGVVLQDNPDMNIYPMPKYSEGKNDVFVGRVRRDFSIENGLNMWVVADNLRKGAATNAVQIAEYLVKNKLV
ncbi:MAG: aspartate-semialdehyde dehydrogenase [Urechidicola sp.]|jgi:aspartate-semialdehyde dehydrogenase|tara:strand:+ start:4376 stop:5365 length:990 start_codon:yes stop_codon:yes gene_type:complete